MMQEIVFTSARRGLRSGSTGFCTVRSTRGMPGNLAQLLERLTGYAHVFDAYGAEADWNPVNYAHYVARLGGQRFQILARICNAPLDHTNRSNKLAHVLTTDSAALAMELSEGPASESLLIPWVRAWSSDSEPYVLSDDQQLSLPMAAQVRTDICEAWKDAAGDAGWAAVLASYAGDSQTPLQVILPRDVGTRSEHWTLRLVNEALSLLPPESRWNVSYSTFFTGNLPVSISCQWQFVLDGTDLAKKARFDPGSRTIDLPAIREKKLLPPKNELTEFARTGGCPWSQEPEAVRLARRRKSVLELRPFGPVVAEGEGGADVDALADQKNNASTDSHRARNLQTQRRGAGRTDPLFRRKTTPLLLRPSSLLLLAVLGLSVVLVLFSAMRNSGTSNTAAQVLAAAAKKAEQRRRDSEQRAVRQRQVEEELAEEERRSKTESGDVDAAVEHRGPEQLVLTEPPELSAPVTPSGEDSEPEKRQRSPLQEIRDKGRTLELRLPASGLQVSNEGPMRLATIHVDSLDHVSLKRIIGGQSVLKSGYDFIIVQQPSADQPFREWEVIRQPTAGGGLGTKRDVVGTFRLNQRFELSFRWDRSNSGFEIVNCLLVIEAGDPNQKTETEKCFLREVEHVRPIRFDLSKTESSERLVSRALIASVQSLELTCEYADLPERVTRQGPGVLRVGESMKFLVQPPATGMFARTVTMTVSFVETEQDVQVRIKAAVEIPEHDRRGEWKSRPEEWTPGLAARFNDHIDEYGLTVDKRRDELKEMEATVESGRSIRDEKKRKKAEDALASLQELVDRESNRLLELRTLAKDLEKLMSDIAKHGQLKYSLRLKVPDAEPGGIELLVTDGLETTQKE